MSLRWIALLVAFLVACGGRRAQLRKADAYLEEGRAGAAVRAYEKVLERRPGDPEALLGLARAWIANEEPERALVPAQVAVEQKTPGASAVLARALVEAGRGAQALPHAEAAVAERGDGRPDPGILLLLSEARLAARDLPGATAAAEEAVQASGGPGALSLAAWLHARNGNCERGMALGARAITAALADPRVQAEAAAVYRHCGDAVQAQAAASTARTLQAQGPDPWQAEAARFARGGDAEGAIRRMIRLRAVWPEEGRHARDLGKLWASLDEVRRAQHELENALELAPYATSVRAEGVEVVNRRSDSLDREGRNAALKEIHLLLGDIGTKLGDLAGAAASYQELARLEVSSPVRWLDAARAWMRAGQPGRAAEAAAEAVALAPGDPAVLTVSAGIFAQAGDLGRAIGFGRAAWEINPANVDLALDLAGFYEKRGETREARRILEATATRAPADPRVKAAIKKLDASAFR